MATRAEQEKKRLQGLQTSGQQVTNPNNPAQSGNNNASASGDQVTNSYISPKEQGIIKQEQEQQVPDYTEYVKQNPGRTSLEYIYDVTQPKPKPVDPAKEARDRKMSTLYDLGGLLVNLGGVAGGAKAMGATTTASEKMTAHYDKLSNIYRQRMQNYNAGRMQAVMQDAQQLRSDADYRRSLADRRADIQEGRRYESAKEEGRNKSAIALANLRHSNTLTETAARGKESRTTKATTPGKNTAPISKTTATTIKPVSRLQAQKIANQKDPDKARKELLAYFMDHGATQQEAAKEVVKYIPRTAKKSL